MGSWESLLTVIKVVSVSDMGKAVRSRSPGTEEPEKGAGTGWVLDGCCPLTSA